MGWGAGGRGGHGPGFHARTGAGVWAPPLFVLVLRAECVAVRAVRMAAYGPLLPLVHGEQLPLHAKTPSHSTVIHRFLVSDAFDSAFKCGQNKIFENLRNISSWTGWLIVKNSREENPTPRHDGCTILLAVSDILWTQARRRGSRFGSQLAGPKPDLSHCAPSPTRINVTSATGSPPSCGRRCARPGKSGPVGPGLTHHHRFGPPVRPAVRPPRPVRPRRAGANSTATGPAPPCGRRCWSARAAGPMSWAHHSVRQLGRSAACTGSPAAGDCDGLGVTGPVESGYQAATSCRVATGRVTLQVGRLPGRSTVSGTLLPDSSMRALAGRACALLTAADGATTRAQARMHRIDSDSAGPGGAGPHDSDGDCGAGSDPGPAQPAARGTEECARLGWPLFGQEIFILKTMIFRELTTVQKRKKTP